MTPSHGQCCSCQASLGKMSSPMRSHCRWQNFYGKPDLISWLLTKGTIWKWCTKWPKLACLSLNLDCNRESYPLHLWGYCYDFILSPNITKNCRHGEPRAMKINYQPIPDFMVKLCCNLNFALNSFCLAELKYRSCHFSTLLYRFCGLNWYSALS